MHYLNDTLNGDAAYYTYINEPQIVRFSGLVLKGRKVGKWISKLKVNSFKQYRTQVIVNYNIDESMLCKTITFKNGKPQVQIFYDASGKEIWYRFYDKQGRMYKNDNVFPWNYEVLLGN